MTQPDKSKLHKVKNPVNPLTPMVFFILKREQAITEKLFEGLKDNPKAFEQHLRKHMGPSILPKTTEIGPPSTRPWTFETGFPKEV